MPTERNALHVLMVLESHFPTVGGGGAESQVRTLASGLRARGHRVTVLTPRLRVGAQQPVSRVDGIPVCRLAFPRVRFLGGPLLWLRMALFLHQRRGRYDVWHVHIAHHLGAVCGLLGRRLGRPVVLKVSGWWEIERGAIATDASLLARLTYRCLLRADAWQAISQRIANTLAAKGVPPGRLQAIPHAVETCRFRAIVPTDSPHQRILYNGRQVPEKGIDTLLEAFAASVAGRPEARLRIVGSGPMQGQLQARAASLGLEGRVSFEGHRTDLVSVLEEADIAVLPSRIEGLSNTLLECMAAGLPMIASRVSGSEDLVCPGANGWLFEAGDAVGLARCLDAAARMPPAQRLAMGGKAREAVTNHADLAHVLDRLLCLYRGRAAPATATLPLARRPA
jgi:glycosyltransferase involved in cell wall biosynthesis